MIHFVRVPPHPADEPLLAFLFYRPCKVGPRQIVALPRARLRLRAAPVPPMGGFDPARSAPVLAGCGATGSHSPCLRAAALSASTATAVLRAAVLDGAGVRGVDALARQGGGNFQRGYLDCVAEAAKRGTRELDRLQAAARRIAELPDNARSHCKQLARSPCASRSSLAACSPAGSTSPSAPGSTLPSSWLLQACCAK